MEAIDWLRISPEYVALNSLRFTQDFLSVEGLRRALRGELPPSGDLIIHAVRYLGHLYIDNGHCRAMVAIMRGDYGIQARVVNV